MNDPLADALTRHEVLLYKAEKLLIEAIDRKDFDGAKFLWEIISMYLPTINHRTSKQIFDNIEEKEK